MGLDINLWTDHHEEFNNELLADDLRHALSRGFRDLMQRDQAEAGSERSELTQIGQLTGVDVGPLHQMLSWPGEEWLDFRLRQATTDEERRALLAEVEVTAPP